MRLRKLAFVPLLIVILFCIHLNSRAQSAIAHSGYLTEMPSYMWQKAEGDGLWDNLIHNRINLAYAPSSNLNIRLEFRNRFFLGETVRNNALYKYFLENDPGWADMSFNWGTGKSHVVNTVVDRLSVERTWGKFKVKAGRQRVDWGQSLVWNPNDIFNSYSYFDFDYPERPAMDGIHMQYFAGGLWRLEAVLKIDGNKDFTSALLYGFDKAGYQFQIIAGQVNQKHMLWGAAWKGSIADAPFYGEFSYLSPLVGSAREVYLLSLGSNYSFNNSMKLTGEYLYSSNLTSSFDNFNDLSFTHTSVQKLSVTDHSYMVSLSAPVHPLLNISLDYIGFSYPLFKNYYIGPSIEYSVHESLYLSGVVQLFAHQNMEGNQMKIASFVRLKKVF